jgi:hypothetical protein
MRMIFSTCRTSLTLMLTSGQIGRRLMLWRCYLGIVTKFMCWASAQPFQSYLRQELWAWFTVALTMSLKINWKAIDTLWP